MPRRLIAVVALALSTVAYAEEPAFAPDFELATDTGSLYRLEPSVNERVAVVYFWATWCPYCAALAPHLQSLKFEHGERIDVVAVNIFEDGDPRAYLTERGLDFILLPEGDDVAKRYGVSGTPRVFVVGCDRRIHFDQTALPPRPGLPEGAGHRARASLQAPYWAAGIRKGVDAALSADCG